MMGQQAGSVMSVRFSGSPNVDKLTRRQILCAKAVFYFSLELANLKVYLALIASFPLLKYNFRQGGKIKH